MKVIGVGHCRTGTGSLSEFLSTHGFDPCYHGWYYFKPGSIQSTTLRDETLTFMETCLDQLENNEIPNWDNFFTNYKACCDVPIFYPPLWQSIFLHCKNKDNLKFILTTRDSNKWYESIINSIGKVWLSPPWYYIHIHLFKKLMQTIITIPTKSHALNVFPNGIYLTFGKYYDNNENIKCLNDIFIIQNKKRIIEIYEKSNQDVINWFNKKYPKYKSNLFIINLDKILKDKNKNEMYIQLCKFLDIKLTNEKIQEILQNNTKDYYPVSNSTKQYVRDTHNYVWQNLKPLIQIVVTIIFALIAILVWHYDLFYL